MPNIKKASRTEEKYLWKLSKALILQHQMTKVSHTPTNSGLVEAGVEARAEEESQVEDRTELGFLM